MIDNGIDHTDGEAPTADVGPGGTPIGKPVHAGMPRKIGHYTIIRVLGEGGMGTVYEAQQESPRRTVALKVIRAGVASASLLRRFEHEAQILGRLDHPGIAMIFEAGTFDAGAGPQPFFAMELVKGRSLTDYAQSKKLGTRERLELLARIADAVQHAHQKGVIHRDLKPGNILVTDDGQVKVLDFGVARATDGDIQTTTMRTDIGQLVGTVPYMSPEQAAGDPDELDTRSDVYALGVVAYELLSGRLPYDIARKMIHEAVRAIRVDDPTPLSSISRVFRGDIEIIIGKALQKDKDRRYQSASDLASDIHRYLGDEPIVARAPSTWYQLRKFSKRNKALVGGVAAVMLVSIIGTVVSVSFALGEAEQAQLAFNNAQDAREAQAVAEASQAEETKRAEELEQVAEFQASQLSGIDVERMGARLREDLLAEARLDMERRGLGGEEITAAVGQLEESLGGTNLTNVALDVLERNILDRALEAVDEQFAELPLVRARLLQTLATTLLDLGLHDRATAPQTAALEIRRRVLGDEHTDTLFSISTMGGLLRAQGKLTEAEPYYHEAQASARRMLGDEHLDTLGMIGNMGSLLQAQGKLTEAEAYYREALESRRRVLGDEHPRTLISINNVGQLLTSQGKLTEAEPYYHEAQASARRMLGDEHPDTLDMIGNMGSLLQAQGKLTEAEAYYREALESKRRVLGNEHPSTLSSINSMGMLLQVQGKLTEAEAYYREALESRRRVLGDEHPDTLISINNVGASLHVQGKLAEAEAYYREVLEGNRRVLGDEHPDTLVSINSMGMLLRVQGKLTEAEPYCREALEGTRRVLGEEHPNTLGFIYNNAALLRDLGRLEESVSLGSEAVVLAKKTLPDGHLYVGVFQGGHGLTQLLMRRFEGAEDALTEAYDILDTALGPDHNRTVSVVKTLVDLYTTWHEAEPGKGYDAKAAHWRAKLPPDEPAEPETESDDGGG